MRYLYLTTMIFLGIGALNVYAGKSCNTLTTKNVICKDAVGTRGGSCCSCASTKNPQKINYIPEGCQNPSNKVQCAPAINYWTNKPDPNCKTCTVIDAQGKKSANYDKPDNCANRWCKKNINSPTKEYKFCTVDGCYNAKTNKITYTNANCKPYHSRCVHKERITGKKRKSYNNYNSYYECMQGWGKNSRCDCRPGRR